ncbi:heme-binding Shp domain-containing protein [Peptoniphilus vaginalis]|uniref:heme-binding Shp domain-containing protein n=1 Tax=Peptoniphilus vaginalis TaxID=1756987 RepID=UPI000A26FB05|nr:heme-binding Shp domain-containing protein [Peptoniphilus vaginalis]
MKKIINSLCLMALIFISLINVTFAYSQEIAKATPYYIHPVTGVIEDPGNNPGIGQGMTENVVCPQALVETTDDGRIFLSVRYNLANYIKNETFAVQNYGDNSFISVPAEVTGKTAETRDYRFEIPSKNVIVRATFFVGPMGRDVIFYYTISDLVKGNTDFATLQNASSRHTNKQEVAAGAPQAQANIPKTNTKNTIPNLSNLKPIDNSEQVGEVLQAPNQGEVIEQKPVNSKFSAGDLGYDHGLLTKDSPIIKKLYYSDDQDEKETSKTKLGKITLAFIYGLIGLFVILTGGFIILALLSYNYKNKVEDELEERRRNIYE